MPSLRLIVGLGNPGPGYAGHRHNVGFMAMDAMASPGAGWNKSFSSLVTVVTVADQKIWLAKPQTFMNRSGQSVGELARYYQIAPEEILVIHDELDLAFGKVRIKQGGGNGGHNGLRDIDAHFGKDYWRMRVGIGHPGDKNAVTGYVLHDFSRDEQRFIDQLTQVIAKEIPRFLTEGHEALMTRLALACPPPQPEDKQPLANGQ